MRRVLLAVVAAVAFAPAAALGAPTGCTPRGPVERKGGPTGERVVALTFDDGPADLTPQFLDLLEQQDAVATFFVLGEHVAGREALLQRMLADGDMIANHSWNHADLSRTGAAWQLRATNAAIRRATGFRPCLFRPPYGATSRRLRATVAAQRMRSILWDDNPRDYQTPGVDAIVQRVLAQAHPGAIVISHDGGGPRDETLAAYAQIIPALRQRGYRFVTVTALLGMTVS